MGNSLFDVIKTLAEISEEVRKESARVEGINNKGYQSEDFQTEGIQTEGTYTDYGEGTQTEGMPSGEILSEGVQTESTQRVENDYIQSIKQKKNTAKKGSPNKAVNPNTSNDKSDKIIEAANTAISETDYSFIDFKNITRNDILRGVVFSEILGKPKSLRRGRW